MILLCVLSPEYSGFLPLRLIFCFSDFIKKSQKLYFKVKFCINLLIFLRFYDSVLTYILFNAKPKRTLITKNTIYHLKSNANENTIYFFLQL